MYAGQVAHHDEFVLREMGGGGVHSCGKIDFNVPEVFNLPSLKCFDFGQSYLNDLDPLYGPAKEKKIPLIRIRAGREELLSGSIMKRFPTGVSLVYEAASWEEAQFVAENYCFVLENMSFFTTGYSDLAVTPDGSSTAFTKADPSKEQVATTLKTPTCR